MRFLAGFHVILKTDHLLKNSTMQNIKKDEIYLNPQIELGEKDSIFKFILSLSLKKFICIIAISFVVGLIPILVAIFNGNFLKQENDNIVNVLEDFGNLALYLIGLPSLLIIVYSYFKEFPKTIAYLREHQIVFMEDVIWEDFIKWATNLFSKWIFTILPYLISFVITLVVFISFSLMRNDLWYSLKLDGEFNYSSILMVPVIWLTFYFLSASVFKIIAVYLVLKKLFNENSIDIQPLHPDLCGGLAVLGKLSKSLNFGIFLWGAIVFLNVYQHIYGFYSNEKNYLIVALIIIGYIFAAYVVFFIPLKAVHSSMKSAKDSNILLINENFNTLNSEIRSSLKNHEPLTKEVMGNLQNLNELHIITSKMPVYPYNIETITSFISSILIPVLLSVLTIFIEKIFK